MLSKVIKDEYIQLDVQANNFEDAIKKALQPFLEADVVTEKYIEAILRIYEETGPYIVITKNIALPHAPVEEGAKDVAIGFTRLKTPVVSGHSTNDPVKYLFPLSAKDSQSHIELLSELANLLGDPEFLGFIETVPSEEEFKNYITKTEGENKNE
ncbi:PTS sugar transporter subunit IIA [Enterococcus xiangfangensis]|uniref:Ascorbate-specific PTS system EIIA component n=1 Tax=Enterococcus xiangfangensis TaxID=1296537 RepID=A0ABU3FBT3_9ENTE|nr:PTS sugar transporter subunit IIA [Enterococcus xiangfangensis]MBM7712935.1 PTS system ascorbate-specific IIA component [Enterococcus xiangfangensis]MDT2760118.1 PTS sugar transporter subunit IIA [Enterococcus xiangfangensis]NBK07649.1 PTS sugar transporter subunit IIA [Enterococcus asini]